MLPCRSSKLQAILLSTKPLTPALYNKVLTLQPHKPSPLALQARGRASWLTKSGKVRKARYYYREPDLDGLMDLHKHRRVVMEIKNMLTSQTDHFMLIRDIEKEVGSVKKRDMMEILEKYPRIFKVTGGVRRPLELEFTDEAAEILHNESEVRKEMEPLLVRKLSKLLMLAIGWKLELKKIHHIHEELGLPRDFASKLIPKYPHMFVLEEVDNLESYLVLKKWDPNLAFTSREMEMDARRRRSSECGDRNPRQRGGDFSRNNDGDLYTREDQNSVRRDRSSEHRDGNSGSAGEFSQNPRSSNGNLAHGDRSFNSHGDGYLFRNSVQRDRSLEHSDGNFNRNRDGDLCSCGNGNLSRNSVPGYRKFSSLYKFNIKLPRTLRPDGNFIHQLEKWQQLPFPSPYNTTKILDSEAVSTQKRNVALIHELLSLTVEKRLTCSKMGIFHFEFRLPVKLVAHVVRHLGVFYITDVGEYCTVFLKEEYEEGRLLNPCPLVKLHDQFLRLMGKKGLCITRRSVIKLKRKIWLPRPGRRMWSDFR